MNDFIDPSNLEIPEPILRMVPAHFARTEKVLPIRLEGDTLVLAVDEFDDDNLERMDRLLLMEKLRFVCNREIRFVTAPRVSLRYAIWRLYPGLFIRSVRGEYFRGGKCTGWLGSGGWADRPLSPWGLAIVG